MSSLLSAINASASGLDAQRARMEVAASNLANADSTHGPNGEPYRRREVVLEATDPNCFGATLNRVEAAGVRVKDVVEDQSAFQRRYDRRARMRTPMGSSPCRTSRCRKK
jgi:flagellar basal-body rod protein FlgC